MGSGYVCGEESGVEACFGAKHRKPLRATRNALQLALLSQIKIC